MTYSKYLTVFSSNLCQRLRDRTGALGEGQQRSSPSPSFLGFKCPRQMLPPLFRVLGARAPGQIKAMLHEAIFLATNLQRNKRCVASCTENFTCNTLFSNCNCCVASFKKCRATLFFSEHPLCNLKGFLFVIVALQVARKISPCNMALRRPLSRAFRRALGRYTPPPTFLGLLGTRAPKVKEARPRDLVPSRVRVSWA